MADYRVLTVEEAKPILLAEALENDLSTEFVFQTVGMINDGILEMRQRDDGEYVIVALPE